MASNSRHSGNVVLLRGATLWMVLTLILAWFLVLLKADVAFAKLIFKDFDRLLQGHIDLLLMSALILGFYGAHVPFPWHVRWTMVIGALTNSAIFILQSVFPLLDAHDTVTEAGAAIMVFRLFSAISLIITTYGFSMAAILVFRSTFDEPALS